MADNSLQGGTDSIRDIDRSGAGPKTQVFQLDHGGSGASESLTSTTNPLPSYRPDQTASGTIAALNATVSLAINGVGAMRVQITGTWVGTLQFEGTVDGTNWVAVNAVQAGSTTIPQNTTTNGLFSPTPAGFAQFRVNATAWTSGTATVSIRGSVGVGGIYHNQYLPAFSVIPAFKIDQTTPGTTNAVSITNASLAVTGTFWQTTQPVSLTSTTLTGTSAVSLATLPALTAGAAVIGAVTQSGTWNVGSITTLPALATGANVIGGVTQSGTWNITNISGTVSLPTGASTETTLAAVSGKLPATLGAKASSASLAVVQATDAYALQPASSTSLLLSAAATTNATSVKGSAGAIKTIHGYNAKTSAVYLKLYNKATAPTVGTDTPVKTIYLPASTAFVLDFPAGYSFATGIAYALTLLAANADTTALVAGDVLALNVDYL